MTSLYRYGIIGTGRPHGSEGATGFGMAHPHYVSFQATGRVDLVAIADIRDDNAGLFLKRYDLTARHYRSYPEMLAQEHLDIVSICTWPHLHAEMAVAAAEAGVKAIHCEKPMATTWGDCKRMKAAADANGAKLTFGHQRRHIKLFQAVRQAVRDGEIGDLVMVEAHCGDLYDWGTHWLDMMFLYNNDEPAEWVIGQIDSRREKKAFGAIMEEQGITHFKWRNGVRGVFISGYEAHIGAVHRLIGTEGMIEVLGERRMRIKGKGDAKWRLIEVAQGDVNETYLSAIDVVQQLDEPGHKSLLSADYAIQHTAMIFGTYLSSRERARIDLPMEYDGSAFLDMWAAGEIGPARYGGERA